MRFGTFLPQGWRLDLVGIDPAEHWNTMRALAQRADAGPWESLWLYDHFHTVPAPTDQATHEVWTLMSAFAAVTDRIRLGQMCTCMGYRNPGYLAKVAATVDHVSGGRVEMGIGAGWYEHEWRAYGYGFPPIGQRLRMLREGVEIMHQLWTTGRASLDGREYQVDGAICEPRPLQPGGVPIWIAGGGEKVTLKIAAHYADYTNYTGTLADFDRKNAAFAEHCATIGRDPQQVVHSSNFHTIVGEDEAEVRERLAAAIDRQRPYVDEAGLAEIENDYATSDAVGTVEQVTERLAERARHGLGYSNHYFPDLAYDLSGVELFEQKVIPELS